MSIRKTITAILSIPLFITAVGTTVIIPTQAQANSVIKTSTPKPKTALQQKYDSILLLIKSLKQKKIIAEKETAKKKARIKVLEKELSDLKKTDPRLSVEPAQVDVIKEYVLLYEAKQKELTKTKNLYVSFKKAVLVLDKRIQGWTKYSIGLAAAVHEEKVRLNALDKWGVYPLPVSVKTINVYGLSKNDVIRISQSSAWANTPKARSVVLCESGGDYSINTGNGYYGAWQFDYSSWLANGGGRWAQTANYAPKWAQDLVAYDYWSQAGWGPWACA